MDDADWHRAWRLEVLTALIAALDHRDQVMTVVEQADTADAAQAQLADLFGLSDTAAVAILDMQVRRFAQLERSKILAEWEEHLDETSR